MRGELALLPLEPGATMISAPHDGVEAMPLADKIVVLRDGRIEQAGRPVDLYQNPDNLFVAGFIGSPKMNFVAARVTAVDGRTATVVSEKLGALPIATTLRGASAGVGAEVTL